MASSSASTDPAVSRATADSVRLHFVRSPDQFPEKIPADEIAAFLHRTLGRFGDEPTDIARGIADALSPDPPGRGFILLATEGDRLLGALVMLRTGMSRYVPENLLLYVAVEPEARGRGIGARLCREATAACEGDVKLHVEYDNPAKRLYERLGFENKYAEMRLSS